MGQEKVVTRDDLIGARTHDNVLALARVVRVGESSLNDDTAYRILNGGELFDAPPWQHPNRRGKNGLSTAAGAYQAVYGSWMDEKTKYGFEDFAPHNQDLFFVARLVYRKALEDVIAGRLDAAVRKLLKEWDCFNNPVFFARVPQLFAQFGGRIADQSAPRSEPHQPVPEAPTAPPEREVSFMSPIVLPILSALTSLIPQLGQLFGSGSEVANRNIAAGSILAQKITEVTHSVNLQEAAEKIQNSPEALRAARDAVSLTLPQLLESGGGGIAKAREIAYSTEQVPYWKNPAFVIAAFLSPLIYMVSVEILFNPSGQTWSDDIKMMFVTAIVSGLLGSITGFFLGSSLTTGGKRATDK